MFDELVTAVLSSAGLTGSLFSVITAAAVKKAKNDADKKREERLRLEILRLEGEEKLSTLIFAIIRNLRCSGSETELQEAEKAYSEYLEKSNQLKNEIIGSHTSN